MQKNQEDVSRNGLSWKAWRQKKKEEYQKWKQEKLLKKKQKSEDSKQQLQNSSMSNDENNIKNYTVSIAVPGSILDNAQSPELKTYLAGQVARAAAVFNVTEIVVFDEMGVPNIIDDENPRWLSKKNGCGQMARILQYLECPQYLRKYFFPMCSDLEYAGLLNPLDTPHHLRIDEESEFREGIVMKKPVREGKGSYVYIGLHKSAVIDKCLEENVRVTVQLDKEQTSKKHYKGKAVSPTFPYRFANIYWGYNVRLAKGLNEVFTECPYKDGYDVTIGTSDKGDNVDNFQLPPFKHLLICFGGLRGLEASIEDNETLTAESPRDLFQFYLNTCPHQGSRTIRTEEALFITLAALRPQMMCL